MCYNLRFVNYSYFHKQEKKRGKDMLWCFNWKHFQNYTATFSSWILKYGSVSSKANLNEHSSGFETLAVIWYLLGTGFSPTGIRLDARDFCLIQWGPGQDGGNASDEESRPLQRESACGGGILFQRWDWEGKSSGKNCFAVFRSGLGCTFFSLRGSGSTLMPCRQWSH